MKKSLIILGLMSLSLSSMLKAQDEDTRDRLTIGFRAGINYSNVWDAQGQDFKASPRVGFAGGVFAGIPLGTFLGFQPEVLLSQKGFQGSGTLLDQPYSFSRTTTYIDVPLQLQLKPSEFLTIVLGPEYSYLINEEDTYTYGINSSSQEQAFNNDNIRKNIFGLIVGADVIIEHFVISGRVGWDLQTNNGNGTSSTPRYKNQWGQLTIGFRI
jgi:hypothetical protein